MISTTKYSTYPGTNRLEQRQLQQLAKDIMEFGEIVDSNHFEFSTNAYTEDGSMEGFKTGGRNVTVQGFDLKYYIHFHGLRVTEIIEECPIK